LLFLECVFDGASSNNMIQLIIEALTIKGALTKKYMTKKLVSFGVDKVSILQGTCNGVIVQIQNNYAPHMVGVHCKENHKSLVVQSIKHLSLILRLKGLP
jgi:hypothetical protein